MFLKDLCMYVCIMYGLQQLGIGFKDIYRHRRNASNKLIFRNGHFRTVHVTLLLPLLSQSPTCGHCTFTNINRRFPKICSHDIFSNSQCAV